MAKLYEMCNEINSDELLSNREDLTQEEKDKLLANFKESKESGQEKSDRQEKTAGQENIKKKKHKKSWGSYIGKVAVAAALVILIVPNVSANAAYAMSQIPLLGNVIKMITVREYNYDSDRFEANIKEAKLVSEENETAKQDPEVKEKTDASIQTINEDIQSMTDRLIKQFEADVELDESYGGVYVNPEVITDTDTWFTVRITVTQVAGSGTEYQYFYHIDKTTGEIATLKDLFKDGADYKTAISDDNKKQMREQMAADENVIYWLDDEEVPEWNFQSIKDDQNFYLDENGQIVICFDEYEVGPGSMGLVQFTIDPDTVADILK